ncbi:hypothetical protein A3G63_01225 [Candidatus Kaiserbacteria bacterium RIFCSPLOWO2_12_FULL_52_8]|uniref:Cadherin domain-containing protein n=1 Tax=Candidatus Kaiserbacteria bacterium RIFCSPHIGHO2_01_FULL_53_31 TaxID=1798481 RepID=A0A1F6CGS8_9BACT|nr:MAG: hypothetical protein A2678_01740 [Candidatus Kaiserbacteria bacterium RIFCSPHIGHO2_01_FULL_53_31]OGG93620.1 MAG: hypothetical protein A3G63_01225 [Candidatus Kaiserbacteria bacterium RIFCSPLOWO2_12_FULL_52_8]
MKKILLSVGSLFFVGALFAGATGAYLNQTQSSTGNTFATGVIDLKVDNESYVTDNSGELVFSPTTSWELSDLAGKLFFNFLDLKPGDLGEDTISLHVNNNDAWVCMKVSLTATPENGIVEPEAAVDSSTGANQGELQKVLKFAFWADDGDNVYEKGEKIFKEGLVKNIFKGQWWTIADSRDSIWQPHSGGYHFDSQGWHDEDDDYYNKNHNNDKSNPLRGNSTAYIGKAWCFGSFEPDPVNQDGVGKTGTGVGDSTNGPLVRGTGFTCDGEPVGNKYQSDGIRVDVAFQAVQSRDNKSFTCTKGYTRDDHDDDDDYDR